MSKRVSHLRLFVSEVKNRSQTSIRLKSSIASKASDPQNSETNVSENEIRFNRLGIPMISSNLRQKLFGEKVDKSFDKRKIIEILRQLRAHGLNPKRPKQSSQLKDFNIDGLIPKLLSSDLSEHFQLLGQRLGEDYKRLAFNLIDRQIPEPPEKWVFREGWTRYVKNSEGLVVTERVEFPLENDLVFDVEVCMKDGRKPTLATAASSSAWYSWCSQRLAHLNHNITCNYQINENLHPNDLIPMGKAIESDKLVIGHNVSFDRTYIKEQYDIQSDRTRFLDTMSLHMCVSGLTQHQRTLQYSEKGKHLNDSKEEENGDSPTSQLWSGVGSLNNLVDVYHLYCDNNQMISKDPRNIFISGSINDVFDNFQELVTYCSTDVKLTHQVFKTIFPIFLTRFPHPITFAGMLEMSVMYLPVIPFNWNRYISECETIYKDRERELNLSLREIANNACSLAKDDKYTEDVWLWDLDWSTQSIRFKKSKPENNKKKTKKSSKIDSDLQTSEGSETNLLDRIKATRSQLMKVQPLMPGYPKWYIEFCSKLKYDFEDKSQATEEDLEWEFGPYLISTQMRSVPKLMRLMWKGFPLHYDEKHGWGYLTPDETAIDVPDRVPGAVDDKKNTIYFPFKRFKELIENRKNNERNSNSSDILESVQKDLEGIEVKNKSESIKGFDDVIKGCLFYRLPHRGGPDKRVGNPLSKDFLKKVEDGSLYSYDSSLTDSVLRQSKSISYWKNSSNRIKSQIVVQTNDKSGAILPRVIVAGTVTRRAVEQTWLTASNVVADRLGSELKSIIQCPDGYHYVGADVDSQELWIASLIGDSNHSGIHGSTGIGWMTLEGNKAQGTDMHSQTAKSINISRDEAKVLNYARIYGSGQPFASRFLMQSNPDMDSIEAKEKAKTIFVKTKGIRRTIKSDSNDSKGSPDSGHRRLWIGGTESDMFNKLEEIAQSAHPRTPVLECQISRALEPSIVKDNYITSRINWVVQSSAVDFLHIMLVTMKWLFTEMQIDGRFSISIHDELRYLVRSEDRYRAALALQMSNLLTRSLFAYKLGFNDLPLSVAFFSTIDIDKCLRKEVNLDSKTPSNPLGLKIGYGIDFGESLDISQLINKLAERAELSSRAEGLA